MAKFYYGWVVFFVFLRLEVFSVRVYVRVSYRFVGLRFFLGFRVLLRLVLARFAYGLVGFRVFQRLEVFS